MATEAHKFQVGAFVIVATAIAIGTVIWLGASRFLEDTKRYVTYFSESVQGLDPGSAVKYRGVPIGRVHAISIAPDGNLIQVAMDVDIKASKFLEQDPDLRAQLQLSGITGLRYVEIERQTGAQLNEAPTLTFKPPYSVLPSARSSFKAIESALGDVYGQVMKVDVGGISNDLRATLQSANQLFHDDRINTALTNIAEASAAGAKVTQNLERTTSNLTPAVENATKATAEARELFAKLSNGVDSKQLGESLVQINRLVLSAQQFVLGLQSSMERVDRTVSNLQNLTEQLRAQPSLLLFSEPPARRPVEGKPQ